MIGAWLLLATGTLLFTAMQADERHRWRRSLLAYRLSLPRDLSVDDITPWLATFASATHPPRGSLFPLPPVVIEVVATERTISHYVLVSPAMRDTLLATVRATLPGARLDEEPSYLCHPSGRMTIAAEFTTSSRTRRLAVERVETVSASVAATLHPLQRDERLLLQVVLTSAGTPDAAVSRQSQWPFSKAQDVVITGVQYPGPLLGATLRIGATAGTRRRASSLIARAGSMLPSLNTPGTRLVRRFVPSFVTCERLVARSFPLIEWPLRLTAHEAAGLIAMPYHASLPGMPTGQARQLPPPPTLPATGTIVGRSDYPGLSHRLLALATADRLRHVHLIGPTGSGKSTLLARMALQDIARGAGVAVIDLKGDLVSDIAARIPTARLKDVVMLDPSDVRGVVVGFNPLRVMSGECETARELVAEQVLSIFHSLYSEFWGPRTDEILRAALMTMAFTPAPDGSAFTLVEVPELLISPALRHYVTAHPNLPPALRSFWQWFDGSLKAVDRVEVTGPVLNKLRAFTMRTSLRLTLGQSEGIALDQLLARNGVALVSLAKGTMGAEAASLLGSLFLAALWQAAQARIALPPAQRRPFFAYLDEFQDIVRLGDAISPADMLAQARGLGLSLTLAHQYLSQLPDTVREATLGTVRTHIAFQLEWDDAHTLAVRFTPLSRDDLTLLNPFEFAMKPSVAGQTLAPVTGSTVPLCAPVRDSSALVQASRTRHGLARAAIEAGLESRLRVTPQPPEGRYGRETKARRTQEGRP